MEATIMTALSVARPTAAIIPATMMKARKSKEISQLSLMSA